MNAREALATHLGQDYAELPEFYYQESSWNIKIVAISDNYYTATKTENQPIIRNRDGNAWHTDWILVEEICGWKIWKSETE